LTAEISLLISVDGAALEFTVRRAKQESKPWRWRSDPKIQNGSSQAPFVLMNDDAGVLALCFSFQQSN